MDPQSYINHPLNASKSKQAYHFPKAQRFPKSLKLTTQAIYALPTTSTKRTTSFGFGCKINLANKTSSPPPGSYNLPSDFQNGNLKSTTTLHGGRETVTFGSFLLETLKRKKNMPSPDKYTLPAPHSNIGGKMGGRLNTDPNLRFKDIPGPGSYDLTTIQLANKGHYALSTIKQFFPTLRNPSSPRYFSNHRLSTGKPKHIPSLSYTIQQKQIGKHVSSCHQNTPVYYFPKASRPSLADRSKMSIPGAKYRSFSQFGN